MDKEAKLKKARWEALRFRLWIIFLHLVAAGVMGLSLFPTVGFFYWIWKTCFAVPVWLKILCLSLSISIGFFLFGLTLIMLCALTVKLFGFRVRPGLIGLHSWEGLRWMGYNSMILVANSAFLDVLRLSPFQTMFYRWMGAKIGSDVNINTAGLADLSMLQIGDNVIIGGGVALICHAADRGFIRLAPTTIGNNVSIGIGSVIMPDCQIGDGAVITPCSFLPKGTQIPPRGVWGGNPVKDLREQRRLQNRQEIKPPEVKEM
jgi:acetyltransferase-like isoleucine patch superfamily enzyme